MIATARALELKKCPRCQEEKPLEDFGVCRARADGRNLYCKVCIREKINAFRRNLRAYQKRQPVGQVQALERKRSFAMLSKARPASWSTRRFTQRVRQLEPDDRVLAAIRAGAHTQREIRRLTKLSSDEVCDALAQLLLWSRKIRTTIFAGQRHYFFNEWTRRS